MYHYEYVKRKQAAPYKANLIEFIHKVQDEVRDYFTFQFTFIGSSSRDMITFDPTTNIGFDFDVNIEVNDDDENYTPKEIRTILCTAFSKLLLLYGYCKCVDSTRVITIKAIDFFNSRIIHSCDFAIVYNAGNRQQYIRYNKGTGTYTWEYQKQPYKELEKRADYLKKNGHWDEVRDKYLDKKNNNTNPNKHSRSLYAEAVNECYLRYKK